MEGQLCSPHGEELARLELQQVPEWQSKTLLAFFNALKPDHARRYITEIWAFSLEELESIHGFIQWLFPLKVPSPVNPEAPTLDKQCIANFLADSELRRRLRKSLDLMLNFYGLTRSNTAITRAPNFPVRSQNWLTPNNHNHLRLTRILTSLFLCGLQPEATSLLATLLEIANENRGAVTTTTLHFWHITLNPV